MITFVTVTDSMVEYTQCANTYSSAASAAVGDVAKDIQELHYHACQNANPDPQELATRLFRMELESGYGFFYKAIDTYAEILGEKGRIIYGQLINETLGQYEQRNVNDSHANYRRSELLRMKERWVAASGTVDELAAVIAQDLSSPHRYLHIARQYQAIGRIDDAITWAEDGLDAFAESYRTGNLGDFLIEIYEQQGRWDDAVEIVWRDFSRTPSLQFYKKLHTQAQKVKQWPQWRDRAIACVKDVLENSAKSKTTAGFMRQRFPYTDHSVLVEILLWEGEVQAAWSEAQAGGCNSALWLRLAKEREADHPEDALNIYQPRIEALINQTNNQAYQDAVNLLLKVQMLMNRLERQAEFDVFLARLRKDYKRKRNFIGLLKHNNL